jgi:hypothetical protein
LVYYLEPYSFESGKSYQILVSLSDINMKRYSFDYVNIIVQATSNIDLVAIINQGSTISVANTGIFYLDASKSYDRTASEQLRYNDNSLRYRWICIVKKSSSSVCPFLFSSKPSENSNIMVNVVNSPINSIYKISKKDLLAK